MPDTFVNVDYVILLCMYVCMYVFQTVIYIVSIECVCM